MTGEQFAPLVQPHVASIMRVAAALVGQADAEDAVQEAVLRAWQAWGELREASSVRGWLLRIVINVCRDWQRGRFGTRQRLNISLAHPEALTASILGGDPGASDHAAALDLRQAINTLDEPLRLVIALRYYGGMDATEIGAALAVPPATIRTRLRRALSLLREHMCANTTLTTLPDRERSR